MGHDPDKVAAHYDRDDIAGAILAELARTGAGPIDSETLAPYDEFHIRGREATAELLSAAGFTSGMAVLDVGCGIGGPARFLAESAGCRVTGIDITPAFCQAAERLTAAAGLDDRVAIRRADALAMPFQNAAFDGAWMLHAAMNIPDKPGLYGEIARVLKPGAVFAAYEIHAGAGPGPLYPTPWAEEPSISHLVRPEDWRGALEAAGLAVESWRDLTAPGAAWFAASQERIESGAANTFGPRLIMGANFRDKVANMARNTAEGRVAVVEAICRRR